LPRVPSHARSPTIRFKEAIMFKLVLDALFALSSVASLALLAWGGWLVFSHSRGFRTEGQNRSSSGTTGSPTSPAR
jgi:hypothetical protein